MHKIYCEVKLLFTNFAPHWLILRLDTYKRGELVDFAAVGPSKKCCFFLFVFFFTAAQLIVKAQPQAIQPIVSFVGSPILQCKAHYVKCELWCEYTFTLFFQKNISMFKLIIYKKFNYVFGEYGLFRRSTHFITGRTIWIKNLIYNTML